VIKALNVARWEWFKLQRRRVPWILLGLLLAFTQLAIWGTYVAYNSAAASGGRVFVPAAAAAGQQRFATCNDLQGGAAGVPEQTLRALQLQCQARTARLAAQYRSLTPAGSISTALGIASTLGLVLVGILSSIAIGSEYGLGTLRPILVRGIGRLSYLAGQFAMLYAVTAAALAAVVIAAGLAGFAAGQLTGPPPDAAAIDNAWTTTLASVGKTWAGLVVFITLAGAITVFMRSTAAGMAVSLGYYSAEGILARLLTAVFDWFDTVAEYLPMANISALAGGNFGLPLGGPGGSTIEPLQAGLVLTAYVIVFGALAGAVFLRRDIAGASGR
jgi:ABC-type transport system involved in multi-copper enzyme maturation permease subunit